MQRDFSICWLTYQMPPAAKDEPGESRKPGSQSLSPRWVAATQRCEPFLLPPTVCWNWEWSWDADPCTLIWDVGLSRGVLTTTPNTCNSR